MKPGMLGFVPRTRTAMESVDLGLSLLQVHWREVAGVWGLQVLVLLGLVLPFFARAPLWSLLIIWWLKPWLDRGVLFVLSRVVFGQSASLWDFLGDWRGVHRTGLVAGLLWRRFSPMRSYVLPVAQLEGLRGGAYHTRARTLTRQGGGAAFLLTCSGWVFTILTFIGFLALVQGMMPPGSRLQVWGSFQSMTLGYQWFLLASGIVALTLTEPLFVAGGFGLYLNRRTHLEGWDLELAFRRLAARLALFVILLLSMPSLRAQQPQPAPADETSAKVEVEEPAPTYPPEGPLRPLEEAGLRAQRLLKEDPSFKHTEEVRVLTYEPSGREPKWLRRLLDALFAKKEPIQPSETKSSDFLKVFWDIIALIGKILLVGGILAFVLWLVYRFRHRLGLPMAVAASWEAPPAVAGLDIRLESLPHDVPAAARILFVQEEARSALALLYRAALAELVHRKGMEIPVSATEGDCLRAASEHLEAGPASTFHALTRTWQRLAYKDEIPSREGFETLCEAWPVAFGGRS